MRHAAATAALLLLAAGRAAAAPETAESIPELARRAAGAGSSTEERTRNLVTWMQRSFEWTWTDYAARTPEEVIARRGGNCAELASVLETLLGALGIESRWIAEVNIQPRSEERQSRAEKRIREVGDKASVFGLEHNDHRWLEVRDEKTGEWFPADPAVGVVGLHAWLAARVAFGKRPDPALPAVAEITKDMIVPIAILTLKGGRHGSPDEDRSNYYLIEQLDLYYDRWLHLLPEWNEWTRRIQDMAAPARGAFAGKMNLHEEEGRIARLGAAYEALGAEVEKRHLSP